MGGDVGTTSSPNHPTHSRAKSHHPLRWQWPAALGACLMGVAAMVLTLAWLHIDHDVEAKAEENLRAMVVFWSASGVSVIALTCMMILLHRLPPDGHHPARIMGIVLGVAAVARIIIVFTHTPTLSHELYRGIFDGTNLSNGISPYMARPADSIPPLSLLAGWLNADHAGDAMLGPQNWPGEWELVVRVPNPHLHTVYLPGSQMIFAFGATITPNPSDHPASPRLYTRTFRCLYILVDLFVITVIMLLLHRRQRSLWWSVLYAWHPLPLTEVAGSGQYDVFGIAMMLTALLMAVPLGQRESARPGRHPKHRWSMMLAISAMVKPISLPLALFLLRGRPLRDWLVCGGIIAGVMGIFSVMFIYQDASDAVRNYLGTLRVFALNWTHFGGLYELLLAGAGLLWPNQFAMADLGLRVALLIGFIAVIILSVRRFGRQDPVRGMICVLLASVLLSPAANPWYLLWALALMPLAPLRSVWVLSFTISLGYAAWANVAGWFAPWWVMAAAYIPVYAALWWDVTRRTPLLEKRDDRA